MAYAIAKYNMPFEKGTFEKNKSYYYEKKNGFFYIRINDTTERMKHKEFYMLFTPILKN